MPEKTLFSSTDLIYTKPKRKPLDGPVKCGISYDSIDIDFRYTLYCSKCGNREDFKGSTYLNGVDDLETTIEEAITDDKSYWRCDECGTVYEWVYDKWGKLEGRAVTNVVENDNIIIDNLADKILNPHPAFNNIVEEVEFKKRHNIVGRGAYSYVVAEDKVVYYNHR